jgi:hypothetical protein
MYGSEICKRFEALSPNCYFTLPLFSLAILQEPLEQGYEQPKFEPQVELLRY